MRETDEIIRGYGAEKRFLIPILQDIQAERHYLPPDDLRTVARRLRVPLVEVYGLVTFYNCFSLAPRGRHFIRVCVGTACHLKGGAKVIETLGRELRVREGEMTPDGRFSYEKVRCLGCCSLAPVVVVNERYHPKMSASKTTALVKRLRRS